MKYFLLLFLTFLTYTAKSQYIITKKVIAQDSLRLNNKIVTSFSDDTTLGEGSKDIIPTQKAVKGALKSLENSSDSTYQKQSYFHRQTLYDYSNNTFTLAYPPDLTKDFEIIVTGISQSPNKYSITGQTVDLNWTTSHDDIIIKYYSNEK